MRDKTIKSRNEYFDTAYVVRKIRNCPEPDGISLFFSSEPNVDAIEIGKEILLKTLFEQRKQNNRFDNNETLFYNGDCKAHLDKRICM